MRIVNVRRIAQVFFLALFLWFCVVSSLGLHWWQLRGWPVNWFLQLDPLIAVGTLLTTHTVYAGLLWALATVVLTVLLGRFFCGWVCPFGTLHQFVGYLGKRGQSFQRQLAMNQFHRGQNIKYYVLVLLLSAAGGSLIARVVKTVFSGPLMISFAAIASLAIALAALRRAAGKQRGAGVILLLLSMWTVLAFFLSVDRMIEASLQTGLLDPIPLLHRSVNLVLLPLSDATAHKISAGQRYYSGAWLIAAIFVATLLLNLKTPRFYCRFLCPLGALFGVLGRYALWRIGKTHNECANCELCEANCEGACEPAGQIRIAECVLCMNCLQDCKHDLMTYQTMPSALGEVNSPQLTRRGFIITVASGVALIPSLRLSAKVGPDWNAGVIRPPGALAEEDFLTRCIKCGQCMRVCPTNIIQPAGIEAGLEGLWTPLLNFRIGTSGCQLNCVTCGYICPTAAIRTITPDEKLGRGAYAEVGPMRLGTAFVDHGRCLPWAMDRPCIVCQENCPVSPKAIFVREFFTMVRGGRLTVKNADSLTLELEEPLLQPGQLATGDYYLSAASALHDSRRLIVDNSEQMVMIAAHQPMEPPPNAGTALQIEVRLQRPQVDPERCIGCGICEHECPVAGKRAIRVTAENETRSRKHSLLLLRR